MDNHQHNPVISRRNIKIILKILTWLIIPFPNGFLAFTASIDVTIDCKIWFDAMGNNSFNN